MRSRGFGVRAFFASMLLAQAASTALPDVVYSDTFTSGSDGGCSGRGSLDLDHNDSTDFCYYPPCCDCLACCTAWLDAISDGGVASDRIAWGGSIGADLDWTTKVEWSFCADGCYEGPGCGNPGVPVFLGLRFDAADGTHYAWLRVRYAGAFEIDLLDYAYETEADKPIFAGEGFPYAAGDLDCDGNVDFDDIDAFVTALIGEGEYVQVFPDCAYPLGDMNRDSAVDFDDIDPFIECLINGGCE